MRNSIPAYITIDDKPLCTWPTPHMCEQICGHRSIAAARRAWREIVKKIVWSRVKVVRGHCPE